MPVRRAKIGLGGWLAIAGFAVTMGTMAVSGIVAATRLTATVETMHEMIVDHDAAISDLQRTGRFYDLEKRILILETMLNVPGRTAITTPEASGTSE